MHSLVTVKIYSAYFEKLSAAEGQQYNDIGSWLLVSFVQTNFPAAKQSIYVGSGLVDGNTVALFYVPLTFSIKLD